MAQIYDNYGIQHVVPVSDSCPGNRGLVVEDQVGHSKDKSELSKRLIFLECLFFAWFINLMYLLPMQKSQNAYYLKKLCWSKSVS